jgi:hypothetical protein
MNRQIPALSQLMKTWMQSVDDQLDKLNRGAAFSGRVSFGSGIQIGSVVITTSGDTVTFTNVTDGKHATITLT